ncbi:hypothetical protein [Ascidiaceihabitans sp.]|uniref:hypothetical protein n=2 Tax=Ascidiaceihabitans sp. TaxID=1872644 RepID=UPI0032993C72
MLSDAKMKIPLSDPIWSRLYSAHGLEDIQDVLRILREAWDTDVADDLFWESLHHQDTLYPATYAALPWILDIAPKDDIEHKVFASTVLANCEDHRNPSEYSFQGLSLTLNDHAHSWVPSKLNENDMKQLSHLQDWFGAQRQSLSKLCLDAIPGRDPDTILYLLYGPLETLGAGPLGTALQFWDNGERLETILNELPSPTQDELRVGDEIAKILSENASDISSFVSEWIAAVSEKAGLQLHQAQQMELILSSDP